MAPQRRTNRLLVAARHALLDEEWLGSDPAALLEGSWPEGTSSERCRSLDDAIDARFAWIDEETSRLAERLGQSPFLRGGRKTSWGLPRFSRRENRSAPVQDREVIARPP